MGSRSNFVRTNRSWVEFTAQIPSGSFTSEPWLYNPGDYALGEVVISGTLPIAAGHLTVRVQDIWGNWRWRAGHGSGYASALIHFPTGAVAIDMPPNWFNLVGSAQFALCNGTGSGVAATAAFALNVKMKS